MSDTVPPTERGRIPPEVLDELRASVRALRGELAQRFGIREASPPESRRYIVSVAEQTPAVEGKLVEEVSPVTYALPVESTAMLWPISSLLPCPCGSSH